MTKSLLCGFKTNTSQTKENVKVGATTKGCHSAALLWKKSIFQGNSKQTYQLLLRTHTQKAPLCKNCKTPACQQVSLPPSVPAGRFLVVICSWLAFLSNTGAGGIWQVTSAHFFFSPFSVSFYMYVCVSRKQSDKQHPDLTDGALRPVFLALLPEPVTPAALLWGGRQSWPQPILVPEETQ